jgi:hypothetical protein
MHSNICSTVIKTQLSRQKRVAMNRKCPVCGEEFEYGVDWSDYEVGLPVLHDMDEEGGLCCIDREGESTYYHYLPTKAPDRGKGEYGDLYTEDNDE